VNPKTGQQTKADLDTPRLLEYFLNEDLPIPVAFHIFIYRSSENELEIQGWLP
jgi:hypothetical protein